MTERVQRYYCIDECNSNILKLNSHTIKKINVFSMCSKPFLGLMSHYSKRVSICVCMCDCQQSKRVINLMPISKNKANRWLMFRERYIHLHMREHNQACAQKSI